MHYMLIETVLNDCHKFKCFVYRRSRFEDRNGEKVIVVDIECRRNSQGKCRECKEACPGYDHLPTREFQFIVLWGYRVIFRYTPRRVECAEHGIHVEYMPWAEGKSSITNVFRQFIAHWAKKLSWKEAGEAFKVGWGQVYESVEHVVKYGLKHRSLDDISTLGIDEIAYRKGHQYLTLVYQTDAHNRRLLWIGESREAETLQSFFDWFGAERISKLTAICCDMWKPFIKVIKAMASNALLILDRFHIMKMLNEAVDNTRKMEAARLGSQEEDQLYKSRWCLLKRPENLTDNQATRMKDLLKQNLQSVKAYLLKENFQKFWSYTSVAWASKFLDQWTYMAARSKIDPIKKVVKTLRKHKECILNWFRTKERISNGIVEGFNGKAKLTMRKSYGFRTYNALEIALFHALGNLPEPELTHRFY
jgi:transposase